MKLYIIPIIAFLLGYSLLGQTLNLNQDDISNLAVITNENKTAEDFFYPYKKSRLFELNTELKNLVNITVGDNVILDIFEDRQFTGVIEKKSIDVNNTQVLKLS